MVTRNGYLTALVIAALSAGCAAGEAPAPAVPTPAPEPLPSTTSAVKASAVSTFHCLSVYWSPEGGGAGKDVLVKYRASGRGPWLKALPMRHNPVATPVCRADYRGSIVNLTPGTLYEVVLQLEGTETRTVFSAATWREKFPVARTVKCASGGSTLSVDNSGTPQGYVLYDGTGCTIDTGNKSNVAIAVNASYVILRGFTIRNVKQHGIRIFKGRNIVIEDCDISKWGSEDEKGFGKDCQGGVFCESRDVRTIVIQRCRIHHPTWDSNSWAEQHGRSKHPAGPQTIVFWRTKGNHVIRYNELWSDKDHYFNDVMGIWDNASYVGFLVADSDVYCNYIAHCWDDGIESEGANQNVRVWNNYIEEVMIAIGNAPVTIGPFYAWRNVSGRSHSPPGSQWNLTHGPNFKMGYAGAEKWMTGHMYLFNNTILQPGGEGTDGLGGSSRLIKHCVTRNNILHVRPKDTRSISTSRKSADNDFDYDLVSARVPEGHEKNGVKGVPSYVPGAGFDFETKTGDFRLAADSPGLDKGAVIPNFCDVFTGAAPDMGAHEAGAGPMKYGVKAIFVPPPPPQSGK